MTAAAMRKAGKKRGGKVPSTLSEESVKPKRRKSPGRQKSPPTNPRKVSSVMRDY